MDKKLIFFIISILLMGVGSCFIIGMDDSYNKYDMGKEILINDVAGVNNVILNKSDFEHFKNEYYIILSGVDGYHTQNGDTRLCYRPLNSNIIFSNITIHSSHMGAYVNPSSVINYKNETIAGIEGYSYCDNLKIQTKTFMFSIDNKTYFIEAVMDNENATVEEYNKGIEIFLYAWLNASGYKQ
jgi:hypothetical protein